MGISGESFDEALIHLFELGLIEVDYNEDLEAVVKLTDAGKKVVEEGQPDV